MNKVNEDYVTVAEAANIMGKGMNFVGKLCRANRFLGAVKMGNSWIIPRESVLNYKPGKRGPKPRKAKLAAERAAILAATQPKQP
jgi:excisionase family DNA binding protein